MEKKIETTTTRSKNKTIDKPIGQKDLVAAISKIALSCYGVSKLQTKHFYELNKKKMKLDDSIEVTMRPTKTYHIRIYLSLAPQVKLTEVLSEVQKRIKYEIETAYKIKIRKIDVYAQTIE